MADASFTALHTERLVLRRFRPEDLEVFVAYRSDPVTARYQSWDAPYRPSQARRFLDELEAVHPDTPGEWFQFAVAMRGTDRLIGDCAAHVQAEDPRQAEIGFTLAPQHQGHGYATEAVRRLLHYLLTERGKHRVRASCDDRNTSSVALLERVGMRREGHLLESTWSKGEWTNDLLYAVLRREWPTPAPGPLVQPREGGGCRRRSPPPPSSADRRHGARGAGRLPGVGGYGCAMYSSSLAEPPGPTASIPRWAEIESLG